MFFFGYPFPNTYYAKVGADLSSRFSSGVVYAAPLLGALTLVLTGIRRDLPRFFWVVLSFLIFGLAMVIAAGGDWMTWGRMLLPLLPPMLLLITVLLYQKRYYVFMSMFFLTSFFSHVGLPFEALKHLKCLQAVI